MKASCPVDARLAFGAAPPLPAEPDECAGAAIVDAVPKSRRAASRAECEEAEDAASEWSTVPADTMFGMATATGAAEPRPPGSGSLLGGVPSGPASGLRPERCNILINSPGA